MVDLTYIVTTLLSYYLPIPDGIIKMQLAMALGQLFTQVCVPIQKWLCSLRIWPILFSSMMKNNITIENDHPLYHEIINYLYIKFIDNIKGANMNHQAGKKKMTIEEIQMTSLFDKEIEISFGRQSNKNDSSSETKYTLGKTIIFSSNKSVKYIEKYVEDMIKDCFRRQNNTMITYSLHIEKSDKNRIVSWKKKTSTSNKTVKNTIVKQSVKERFYDDLEQFMKSDDVYKNRGISYKRGYLLHGVPGSGKSSIVAAIANEHLFPVFKLDLSILESNEELTMAENTIYDYIGPFTPHIVLIEDFDRSTVMKMDYYGESRSKITMDCILNVLDGIEQTYGRIVIITANDVKYIKQNSALIRPGRIDRIINIDYCDNKQITEILKLYFDKDANIVGEVKITPANLNKIIQVLDDYDNIVNFINKFKCFNSGEEIEQLAVEFKDNPELEENKVEEIKEKANENFKTKKYKPKSKTKEKTPWGGKQYEIYTKQIEKLKSGNISFKDIYSGSRRDKMGINGKVKKIDSIDLVHAKIESAKQQSGLKIKELEEKRNNLVNKMKSRGSWDRYNEIRYKAEHKILWNKVLKEYKKTWEFSGSSLCKVGYKMALNAPNRLRNYRILNNPEEYKDHKLPSNYFYTKS